MTTGRGRVGNSSIAWSRDFSSHPSSHHEARWIMNHAMASGRSVELNVHCEGQCPCHRINFAGGYDGSIVRECDHVFVLRPMCQRGRIEQIDHLLNWTGLPLATMSDGGRKFVQDVISIERGPAIKAVRCLQRTNRQRYREWYLATHWPDVLEDIFALANRSSKFVRKSRVERYGDVCPGYLRGRRVTWRRGSSRAM